MDKKSLHSPLETALENLDPSRRQFLGLLLAGAAALPALTTTVLAAEDTTKASEDRKAKNAQSAAPGQSEKVHHAPPKGSENAQKPSVKLNSAAPGSKQTTAPDASDKHKISPGQSAKPNTSSGQSTK